MGENALIDYGKLYEAYEKHSFYSIQLEVGDLCYQGCIYCYMNALENPKNTLTDEEINNILDDCKRLGIVAVEWLGGEPLLRENIFEFMARTCDYGIRNNVWTGGLPLGDKVIIENLNKYARNGLIAFHLSTINPEIYVKLHPKRNPEDIDTIINGVRKLLDLGYPNEKLLNSVTYTGMQPAEDMVETIKYFYENFGIKTTVNVYHTYLRPGTPPGDLTKFIPDGREVAKVYRYYAKIWNVKQFPMNCVNKQYCATTFAVLCDGNVTPCATIREKDAPNIHTERLYEIVNRHHDWLAIEKFREKGNLPEQCRNCFMSDECFGCRSRSYAEGKGLYGPDPRCFRMKTQ